jgi:hypothetical protein
MQHTAPPTSSSAPLFDFIIRLVLQISLDAQAGRSILATTCLVSGFLLPCKTVHQIWIADFQLLAWRYGLKMQLCNASCGSYPAIHAIRQLSIPTTQFTSVDRDRRIPIAYPPTNPAKPKPRPQAAGRCYRQEKGKMLHQLSLLPLTATAPHPIVQPLVPEISDGIVDLSCFYRRVGWLVWHHLHLPIKIIFSRSFIGGYPETRQPGKQ